MTVSEFLPAAAGASDMTFKMVPRENVQIVGHQAFVARKLKQISVAFQNPLFPMRSFTKGPFAGGLKVRLAQKVVVHRTGQKGSKMMVRRSEQPLFPYTKTTIAMPGENVPIYVLGNAPAGLKDDRFM